MISLLLAAKSLLWLAMIFPTLEFLISRCEHQFDVHQSPPAKYTVRRQSKPTRYTRINHEKAILFAGNKKCKQDFRYLKSDRCLDGNQILKNDNAIMIIWQSFQLYFTNSILINYAATQVHTFNNSPRVSLKFRHILILSI